MGDLLLVHEVKRQQELFEHLCCPSLSEVSLLVDHVEKISAGHQLHDDVVVSVIFHQFEDTSDVGMVSCLEHLKLVTHQILVHVSHSETGLLNDLDGTWHSSDLVCSNLDSSKGSTTKLFAHFVVITELSDLLKLRILLYGQESIQLLLLLGHTQTSLLLH